MKIPSAYSVLIFFGLHVFLIDPCQAQREVDSLRFSLEHERVDSNKVLILLSLGYFFESGSPDSALAVYGRAYQLAASSNYLRGEAKSLQYSGIVLTELGRYAEAIVFYNRAAVFYAQAHDEKGIATTENNLGNAYLYIADYRDAVSHYQIARPWFEKTGDQYALVVLHGNMAECFRQVSDFRAMLEASRLSFYYAKALDDPMEIANAGISLGTALNLNGQSDSAVQFLQASLLLGHQLNDSSVEFFAYNDLADREIDAGRATEALVLADSALSAADRFGRSNARIGALITRGRALSLNKKKSAEAQAVFQMALSLARTEGSSRQVLETLDALARHEERSGNPATALLFRQQWMNLNDSLFNETRIRQFYELRTLYETSEKEKQLAVEKGLGVQKDEKLYRRTLYLLMSALALVFAVLISFLLIRSNRIRRKLAEQRAAVEYERSASLLREKESVALRSLIEGQEQERRRIGNELHDGLGGMMTAARLQLEQLGKEAGTAFPVDKYMALQNLITRSGQELRGISHDLAPSGIETLGLAESLGQFCHSVSVRGLAIQFECHGENWPSDPVLDTSVYRMVQEMVHNVIKHSGASEAFVSLSFLPESLSIVVEDNGKGFDHAANENRGKGLAGLEARTAFLRGTLEVISSPGKGTSITIVIPRHG